VISRSLRTVMREIAHVARASTPTHAHLRTRVVGVALITLVVDAVATVAMFFLERGAHGTAIHTLFDSFYWTSAQLSTVSTQMPNPLTHGGRLLGLVIDFYSITVVATFAGLFGAFFHKRGMEQSGASSASGSAG
jgi:hypothetical protein